MKSSGATLRDVAKKAGVSIDTVSRVLNGKGKEKWLSAKRRALEIREIAEQLNYRPNAAARAIRNSRTRSIGALVRNNPKDRYIHLVAFETLLGINEGLETAGYVLNVIRFDDVAFDTPGSSRVFHEHRLDGMIVIGGMPDDAVARLNELMPVCVWANTNVWNDHLCIRRDEVHAGHTIGRAMIDLGYRRMVFVGGTPSFVPHYSHDDRFLGLTKAADESGAKLDRLRIPWSSAFTSEFPMELFDPSVAIVADSTPWAQWLLHVANGVGKVPGYHFGLACCDESREVCRNWPGLSRMSLDYYAMGVSAAQMMLRTLDTPNKPIPSQVFRSNWRPGNTAWGPSATPLV